MLISQYLTYPNCFKDIQINKLISKDTKYGLIWDVTYKNNISCALKIVILESGIHHRKNSKYYNGNVCITSDDGKSFFKQKSKPFNNKAFRFKKPMNVDFFMKEIDNLHLLSKINMAPNVYDSGIYIYSPLNNENIGIHYGFILMDKTDTSFKDIIHQRHINKSEFKIIRKKINELHSFGFIHGDLKPSNIGVYLDNGYISKCIFFDCAKITQFDIYNISKSKFKFHIRQDWKHHYRHISKNIKSSKIKYF